ncbi:MAG: hypothetical protein HRT58_18665 [Crocinitomicaceae bacterium]|nr:hypothetical protein [Flavobacteriales bacterium]NQZ37694.1 hypothetical protein [Crocinitomicaceae bacterium]
MVEVYITDINQQLLLNKIANSLKQEFTELKINFDLNETGLSFPRGHTVLRVEGKQIDGNQIKLTINRFGYKCEIMDDNLGQ